MSGSNNSEETEDAISQFLEDLGLLEDGMTANDKRSLWEVIKLSKDTAQAEEQDRQKRARRTLQIDEVSSRSEMNNDSVEAVEEATITEVKSQETKCSRDSSHHTTAASLSSGQSPTSTSVSSSSRIHIASHSPNHQSVSIGGQFYNRELTKPPSEVTARRSLRSQANTLQTQSLPSPLQSQSQPESNMVDDQESSSVSEGSSSISNSKDFQTPHEIENVPSPRQVQNPASPRSFNRVFSPINVNVPSSPIDIGKTFCLKKDQECHSKDNGSTEFPVKNDVKGNPESIVPSPEPVMELTHDESPITSDHESSPIRRIRKGFTLTLKLPSTDESIEDSSALNDNEKEKCDDVPSPTSESFLHVGQNSNGVKKEADDRERNIDAFNCDRNNYDLTLKVRKPRRVNSRLPFYIPPYKMDVHSYIAYFKKCVSDHHRKLLEVQKKSHKCVPWGDPVVVDESDAVVCIEQKDTSSQQRFNFRDRKLGQQKVGTIYEDPNSQNDIKTQDDTDDLFDSLLENEKPTDDIQFIKKEEMSEHSKPNTPERQGSKRKSESSSEMEEKRPVSSGWLTTVSSEDEEIAVKRKKLGTVCYARTANSWKDLGLNFIEGEEEEEEKEVEVEEKRRKGKKTVKKIAQKNDQNTLRERRNRKMLYQRQGSTFKEDDNDHDRDHDESNNFTDFSEVEGAGSSKSHKEEDIIIRPAPLKLKKQSRPRVPQIRQQEKDADVAVIFDATSSRNKEVDLEVPCPICRVAYPAKDIEAHASECNEYCAEEIPEDEEEDHSPQMLRKRLTSRGPSQETWSQYDGVHESSSQGNYNILEAPSSPIHSFVPISAQQNSEIDYHNQFRVARTLRRPKVKKSVRTKKRKRKGGNRKPIKKRKLNIKQSPKVKKFEDYW